MAVAEQKIYHDPFGSNWFAYSLPFGPWWQISLSYWLLLPALLALPLLAAMRFYRQRIREIRGECRSCGYCLVGNTSGVCPECGTAIPKPANSPA